MVKILASAVSAVVAVILAGCGGGDGGDNTPGKETTTTQAPTTPTMPTTTTADSDPRTPLYVVVRLDTVAIRQEVDPRSSSEVIDWFLNNKEKLNLGMMTGGGVQEWPTNCATTKKKKGPCFDETVKTLRKAYADGYVLGTGGERLLEICNNGHDTYSWLDQWDAFVPKETFHDWLDEDLSQSQKILKESFPDASIMTLAVPQNMADEGALAKAKAHGLDIVSTEAMMNCVNPNWEPGAPMYDYSIAPCQVGKGGQTLPQCVPEEDVWVTEDGFQKVGGILSVPVSSANAHIPKAREGISTTDALGVGKCECTSSTSPGSKQAQLTCSLVAAAKNNARKSNELHWTVMLLDPQTDFSGCCNHNNYTKWLDDFYMEAKALAEFNVKFINFQDIPNLRPPAVMNTQVV